jgi:hypothetical protein
MGRLRYCSFARSNVQYKPPEYIIWNPCTLWSTVRAPIGRQQWVFYGGQVRRHYPFGKSHKNKFVGHSKWHQNYPKYAQSLQKMHAYRLGPTDLGNVPVEYRNQAKNPKVARFPARYSTSTILINILLFYDRQLSHCVMTSLIVL